jgi:hypothetical protein
MTFLLYLNLLYLIIFQPSHKKEVISICDAYGSIYIETENRNRADFTVFVSKENSFPDLKVYLEENKLYADKVGHWYFVKDRELADYVIFIEKDKGRARYSVFYTDIESEAGCQ